MSETDLVRQLLLEAPRHGARLFRQNTGHGWIGDATKFTDHRTVAVKPGDVLIRRARPFHAGFDGLADIGGWRPLEISAAMVGGTVAQYSAFEAKVGRNRLEPAQRAFLDAVEKAGGLAAEIRSVEELRAVLRK